MPDFSKQIETPDSAQLRLLSSWLCERSSELESTSDWPGLQLSRCAEMGVFRWFVPRQYGGREWTPSQIVEGYMHLGSGCLTTTFVITQWVASVKRLLASGNEQLVQRLIPGLLTGETHTTVGISHLTTSRRHVSNPVLVASESSEGYVLNGFSPWVTGAPHASFYLTGATTPDGNQVLLVVPGDAEGVSVDGSQSLVALSASQTASVRFKDVAVPRSNLVAGPVANVMSASGAAGTGGVQTSALALSLAKSALDFIDDQAEKRPELADNAARLRAQWDLVLRQLIDFSEGQSRCSGQDLRSDANSLVLRSTQAAMVAAKGAGFVTGHPVGRWCREALFFLVWSCPHAVSAANFCEFAGVAR